ncbi:MAG: hypothetical protein IT317_13580 [Anaerolineales bacterium]|nr:hypothetical protein [Anaerolineales bacterium]
MTTLPEWLLPIAFLACCLAGILLAAALIVVETGSDPSHAVYSVDDPEDAALVNLSERIVALGPGQRELLLARLHQAIDEIEQNPSLIVVQQ